MEIRHSRSASRIARYWGAVNRYLNGDGSETLEAYQGKFVTVEGVRFPFVTDLPTIERLANAGEVRFEDLYVELIG